MPLTTSPSLDADDHFALLQDAEVDSLLNTPLQATVDILLPVGFIEVGLLLREEEWINTAVQVRILKIVSSDLDLMTEALTREATALRVTIMIGHTGRYFEIKRADDPLRMCQSNKRNICTVELT